MQREMSGRSAMQECATLHFRTKPLRDVREGKLGRCGSTSPVTLNFSVDIGSIRYLLRVAVMVKVCSIFFT